MEHLFNFDDEHSSVNRSYRFAPNGLKSTKIVCWVLRF